MKTDRIFGVEIELNCTTEPTRRMVSPYRYLSAIESQDFHERGIHPLGCFKLLPGWKHVYDGTCGTEIVSPPINDTSSVGEMCRRIQASGIRYTLDSCGLHVHVQAVDFERIHLERVVKFCRHFDRTIFSFMKPERLDGEYCRLLKASDATVDTMLKNDCANTGRYFGCNLNAYYKHGTVEFRYAEGTDKAERIEALVELYTSIMDYCHKNPSNVKSPKKNMMAKRIFLCDILGLSDSTRDNLLTWNEYKK